MALTPREKKFVAAFQGNATEAAEKAGCKGTRASLATQGWRMLRKVEVREAIAKREEGLLEHLTFNVAELQQQWTLLAADESLPVEARLAAMRDLAKSQGAFVHRHEHAIGKSLEDFLREISDTGAKK